MKDVNILPADSYVVINKTILQENDTEEDLKDAISRRIHELIPKHITKEDILLMPN